MEENKHAATNQAPDEDIVTPGNDITEISEGDLEQISGGVPGSAATYGIQKDKMKSANKNADAIKGLL